MSLVSRATTPTASGITAAQLAVDVTKYGAPVIALVSALAGSGAISIPGTWLGVVNAVIALLTSLASVKNQQQVATAKAAAKVAVKAAAKKAAK